MSISGARVHADAIVAANHELMDRFNRGDKIGVARMYADDALMLSDSGERIEGRAAIDEYWAPSAPPKWPQPDRPPTWTLDIVRLEGTEAMPVQRGRSRIESVRDGRPRVSDVQFVVVWRKQANGEYRIAVDAWWATDARE